MTGRVAIIMSEDPDRVVSLDRWPPEPTRYSGGHGRSLRDYNSPAPVCERVVWLMLAGIAIGLLYAAYKSIEPNPAGLSDIFCAVGLAMLDVAALVAGEVYFLMWVYRVSANLRAFGAEGLSISPGWAVGYFFIPILCLYKPYRALRDAWQASKPGLDLAKQPESWWRVPSDPRVGWWWVAVLSGMFVTYGVAFITYESGDSVIRPAFIWLDIVMRTAQNVAVILLVTALTTRQEEAARRLVG